MIKPVVHAIPKASVIQMIVANQYDVLEEQLVNGAISAAKYALEIEKLDNWAREQYKKAI